ncbi:N-acetylglucosamine-6-phosphate deacetylase [Gymnodinialimonas hymeniacidonis]|uniref:N-acetylglucosamine-6-phosphate deacetylase n=1 Tax=Gymnodinialimonas hymeniacidonis TaxID=3126508 RepID=UPI0034C610CE
MTARPTALAGAEIFDGTSRYTASTLIVASGRVIGIVPEDMVPPEAVIERLDGGILCPGFVDLQVNGGGGVMFNDDQSVQTLRTMAEAHARLGATSILPTLITDTPTHTSRAIEAVAAAMAKGVPGIVGLHLEGPHLSQARKGAHDPSLIRPMEDADLTLLLEAARKLPVLKVTLAPETVSPDQIARLSDAGILVSLGHSDASFDTCQSFANAGARCVTHLFNAMSQLGSREPGLVGAALTNGALSAGLIADGIHVHPQSVRAAMAAKQGPGEIFLVSDAMAVAGTDLTEFHLNGRVIRRDNNRLTLEDGTLAGADLDLATAVRNIVKWGAASVDHALAMATSIPAKLHPGLGPIGTLTKGAPADMVHLSAKDYALNAVWRAGVRVARA